MDTLTQRPYQIECEQAIMDAGPGRHLIALATGLGKTVIFTHLKNVGRVLILSHRDELVRQPEKYYGNAVRFGVEKADEHASDEEVVSASVQSLSQDARLKRFSPDAFETIIVDEAHHAAAPTYRKILDYFTGAKRILGFTATPRRGDSIGLSCVFDDIIFSRDIRWGIMNNYLSRIRCEEVRAAYSLDTVDKTNGDYSASQLEHLFLDEELSVIPAAAKTYLEKCHNTGRHTLIYCVTKRVGYLLLETIRKMLPDDEKEQVQAVFGGTPDEERAKILSDFQSGDIRCIINCMVLTEGTDLPICDAVLNLRPTCRNTLYQQMVGRGTRLYSGKEYCLVIDVIPENADTSRRTLCTAPTLFGIDPFALPKKKRAELTSEVDLLTFCDALIDSYAERSARVELLSRNVNLFIDECDTVFGSANRSIEQCAAAYRDLCSNKYAASSADFGDIEVEVFADERKRYRIRPNWTYEIWVSEPDILNHVIVQFPASIDPDAKTKHVVSGELEFSDAIELIRMYCMVQPEFYWYCWSKSAQTKWRQSDATFAQKNHLQTLLRKQGIPVTDQSKLSKLDASVLIDLSTRYKTAKKTSEAFVQAASGKRTKKAAAALDLVEQMLLEQESSRTLSESELFDLFRKTVTEKYQSIQAIKQRMEEEARIAYEEALAASEFHLSVSALPTAGQAASDAQLQLIGSLQSSIGLFSNLDLYTLTKRQASLMIGFLKHVKDLPVSIRQALVFPDADDVCLSAETASQTTFTFKQKPKQK